ncbi:uncharacterized protein N7518_010067 [Penicillium psychrosexuale]|uniref:uncharacterized protein n=1 Tax=Penicillium psychrosexuale TaxID=1002107 RepID=UPI0025456672|nr:uncharacterized protein N7518_010067 [Penicillium psychrosexuale]KAJ5781584.1 hypothetical protein N7518_010067 [Penicillium psychrosexuale]
MPYKRYLQCLVSGVWLTDTTTITPSTLVFSTPSKDEYLDTRPHFIQGFPILKSPPLLEENKNPDATSKDDISLESAGGWNGGGEPEKLAMRYRKFNLQALLNASAKPVGNAGTTCVKLLKCVEGQFNKAFLLTMSNGCEIIARLPNPNAGPSFFTTASEVATRHFLRDQLGIPIPRIYDWSSNASNEIGAEYILEEKATGQPLGNLWGTVSLSTKFHLVDQILDIEKRLASITFSKHGCIYYTSDLQSKPCDYELLETKRNYRSGSAADGNDTLPSFAIGPSASPIFWEKQKARMNLDRGPWESIAAYAEAIGKNEIQWAISHARPRMNYHRSTECPETPDDYIALLKDYMALVPFLVPTTSEQPNRISHPDLHLDNIFVDPETYRITSIIDWQQTAVSPAFLQCCHPQMLELSASPCPDQQIQEEKMLLEHYYDVTKTNDSIRRQLLDDPLHKLKIDPISLVPRCWDREDLFTLRNFLIKIVARWAELKYEQESLPVDFGEEELLRHEDEMDLLEGISGIVHQLQDAGLIPLGGMVRPEYYERAMEANERFKQEFIGLAENESQRDFHAKVWPYN